MFIAVVGINIVLKSFSTYALQPSSLIV